jgi:hypothetical protein
LGRGGRITDPEGALAAIRASAGPWLLWALALGFLSYATWRITGAIVDAEADGNGAKGVAARAFAAVKGCVYAAFAADAVALATHASGSSGGWISGLLASRFGGPVVWSVGVVALAFGAHECYRGYVGRLSDKLNLASVDQLARDWVVLIGRSGIAARGAVIGIAGVLLIRMAQDGPDPIRWTG